MSQSSAPTALDEGTEEGEEEEELMELEEETEAEEETAEDPPEDPKEEKKEDSAPAPPPPPPPAPPLHIPLLPILDPEQRFSKSRFSEKACPRGCLNCGYSHSSNILAGKLVRSILNSKAV